MLKILIKKQFTEIFKGYFYNSKNGQARTKTSTVIWFIFFAAIMILCVGGMFFGLAKFMCEGLHAANVDWLYFAIFGMLSLALGIIGSVFSSYNVLYLAKDNDLLVSLPIPARVIVFSRIISVYLLGLMYSAVSFLPAAIVYTITAGIKIRVILGTAVMLVQISVIDLALSCILGYIIAKLSLKMRNKSFTTVALFILGVALYYFFYFKFQSLIADIANNAAFYGERIKGKAYLIYLFGQTSTGSTLPVICAILVSAVIVFLVMYLLSRSFFKIITSTAVVAKSGGKTKEIKPKTLKSALISKEFARLTASPMYMLNSALGVLFVPLIGIVLIFTGGTITEITGSILPEGSSAFTVLIVSATYTFASFFTVATPSVSLEGNNIWILKTLPVSAIDIFKGKLKVQLRLSISSLAVFLICAAIGLKLSPGQVLLISVCSVIYYVMTAFFGIIIGILNANLKWTNEIQPIKQSIGVVITAITPMVYGILHFAVYMLIPFSLNPAVYVGIFALLNIIITALLSKWLNKNAEKKFLEL